MRLREERLAKKTYRLTKMLRWEPVLGVGVLLCVGLMNAFAGTLSPITQAQTPPYGSIPPTIKPFHTTVKTTDGQLILMLDLNPKRLGPNVLTISIIDNSARTLTTDVRVVLSISMLDMDMGTDTLNVQPDGKGHFSINLYLGMQGNWQLRIQVHTPDDKLHEVKVHFFVPF
jgi:copper transport protein